MICRSLRISVKLTDLMDINGQNFQNCATNFSGKTLKKHIMQLLIFTRL